MDQLSDSTDESRFIATSNRGFAVYAQDELRGLIRGAKFDPLVPEEVFMMRLPVGRDEAIRKITEHEPIFLRHVHPVDLELPIGRSAEDARTVASHIADLTRFVPGERVAVQVRKADGTELAYEPGQLRQAIADTLERSYGTVAVVKEADRIVSLYIAGASVYIGVSKPEENLSDWAGGAIRFRREEGQISRAKFKLLEAERKFGIDLAAFRDALDIGAAPGGWTSLLLERGLNVTAVDPAELHPSLHGHPRLTYLCRSAADLAFRDGSFDLLVCDMNWNPKLMARLLSSLGRAVRSGGAAIVTLKLPRGKPFRSLKETVRALSPEFNLNRAKQLFHNRDEITLFFEIVR